VVTAVNGVVVIGYVNDLSLLPIDKPDHVVVNPTGRELLTRSNPTLCSLGVKPKYNRVNPFVKGPHIFFHSMRVVD